MLCERISLSTCSSIKIAGLLKKKRDDDDDDTEFVKSRVSRFSRRAQEAHTVRVKKKFPNWFRSVPFTFRSFLKRRSLSVGISFRSVPFRSVPFSIVLAWASTRR